jgi:uncharacterized protein YukE
MGNELRGIEEDVSFNCEAAATLERELRSAAVTLDGQIPQRNAFASDARQEWRGVYSRQFEGRMDICTGDARRLAGAMELAANQVRELADAAQREQRRREAVREWKQPQDDETAIEEFGERLFGGDEEPPIPEPEPPPHFTSEPQPAQVRG